MITEMNPRSVKLVVDAGAAVGSIKAAGVLISVNLRRGGYVVVAHPFAAEGHLSDEAEHKKVDGDTQREQTSPREHQCGGLLRLKPGPTDQPENPEQECDPECGNRRQGESHQRSGAKGGDHLEREQVDENFERARNAVLALAEAPRMMAHGHFRTLKVLV